MTFRRWFPLAMGAHCCVAVPILLSGFAAGHLGAGFVAILAAGLADFWFAEFRRVG